MFSEPELRFNVDALYDHLTQEHTEEELAEFQWFFLFQCGQDIESLQNLGNAIADEIDTEEQFEGFEVGIGPLEVEGEDGSSEEVPVLILTIYDPMEREQVRAMADRLKARAEEHGVTYEGVSCGIAEEADDMMRPLNLDEALDRLNALTEMGVPPGEPMYWLFAFSGTTNPSLKSLASALEDEGFGQVSLTPEAGDPEEGLLNALLLRSNTTEGLEEVYQLAESLAAAHGVEFEGVQFGDPSAGDDGPQD